MGTKSSRPQEKDLVGSLPPEVLLMVLQSMPDLPTLGNSVRASSYAYRVYVESHDNVVHAVLLRFLGEITVDALVAVHSARFQVESKCKLMENSDTSGITHIAKITAFLNWYSYAREFGKKRLGTVMPEEWPPLVRLCKMYTSCVKTSASRWPMSWILGTWT